MNKIINKFLIVFIIIGCLSILNNFTYAHPGRTDARGCHTCRTNCEKWGLSYGEYHCHTPKTLPQPTPTPKPTPAPIPAPEKEKPITEPTPKKNPLIQADISAGIPKENFSWLWFLVILSIAYFSYKLVKRKNKKQN